jgi:drug/metabolite transporter (DMT)-like permease
MIPIAAFATSFAPLTSASGGIWQAVLALALLSTAFAYILYFDIIAKAGATNASLVTLIVPLFAILLGVAFLSERLHLHEIAGMALIGMGLVIFDGRLRAARIPPKSKS